MVWNSSASATSIGSHTRMEAMLENAARLMSRSMVWVDCMPRLWCAPAQRAVAGVGRRPGVVAGRCCTTSNYYIFNSIQGNQYLDNSPF
ncbi:MAG: hypothetical protein HEQ37_15315 [Acidovorax sp.]|nr:hypothetical protein [Acidovorax sp.]